MGEPEFEEIYNTFQPRIKRYLTRMVGIAEAEDLAQDVFVKVSRGLAGFRGDAQLSTWIYRIATSVAIDRLRSPSFQRTVPGNIPDEFAAWDVYGSAVGLRETSRSVDQVVARKVGDDCVRGTIKNLPEIYRTALVLSEYENLKNQEIANILGVSLDTVKIRLHRARTKLKKELECSCELYYNEWNDFICERKGG